MGGHCTGSGFGLDRIDMEEQGTQTILQRNDRESRRILAELNEPGGMVWDSHRLSEVGR